MPYERFNKPINTTAIEELDTPPPLPHMQQQHHQPVTEKYIRQHHHIPIESGMMRHNPFEYGDIEPRHHAPQHYYEQQPQPMCPDVYLHIMNCPVCKQIMIVKNESKIITRLFESVKTVFDTYCICDTGSTDSTVEIIEKWMKDNGKHGVVISEPFKNFGYNRTHCIIEAQKHIFEHKTFQGDYFLFLDADMKIVLGDKFNKNMLCVADAYTMVQKSPVLSYSNIRFVKTACKVTCVGVTHEYYDIPSKNFGKIDDSFIYIDDIGDGGAKSDKGERDIRLLTGGIADPTTPDSVKSRYYFYRANTFFDTKQYERAVEDYKKRISFGGWVEELWYSKFRIAQILERVNMLDKATMAYLEAYEYYPKRGAETLYELVRMYRMRGINNTAYMFWNTASKIPYPKDDVLFINHNVYDFLLDVELSIIGYYVNHPNVDKTIINLINKTGDSFFALGMSNYKFYCKNIPSEKVFEGTGSASSILTNAKEYMLVTHQPNSDNYTFYTLDKSFTKKNPIIETKITDIKDTKFFVLGNTLYFIGNAQTGVAIGKREITQPSNELKYSHSVVQAPTNNKNRVLFSTDDKTLKMVYEWENFKTYTVTADNHLVDFSSRPTPPFFKYLCGASNGYKYGDCIWFILNVKEQHYHVIVVYNYLTDNFAYTVPFRFEGKNTEVPCGLVVENKNIIVSYSTDETKVVSIDKREVCKLFV